MKILFLPFLCSALLFGWHKEKKLTEIDYLIVGYANQAWGKNCEAYKITSGSVFPDSTACAFIFNTIPLSEEKFQIARPLLESLPEQLITQTKTAYLCETCSDTGSYYIEFQQDGKTYKFSIDEYAADVPGYLSEFQGEIQMLLNTL